MFPRHQKKSRPSNFFVCLTISVAFHRSTPEKVFKSMRAHTDPKVVNAQNKCLFHHFWGRWREKVGLRVLETKNRDHFFTPISPQNSGVIDILSLFLFLDTFRIQGILSFSLFHLWVFSSLPIASLSNRHHRRKWTNHIGIRVRPSPWCQMCTTHWLYPAPI